MTGEMLDVYREVRGASGECNLLNLSENTLSAESLEYLERLLLTLDKQRFERTNSGMTIDVCIRGLIAIKEMLERIEVNEPKQLATHLKVLDTAIKELEDK